MCWPETKREWYFFLFGMFLLPAVLYTIRLLLGWQITVNGEEVSHSTRLAIAASFWLLAGASYWKLSTSKNRKK